MNDKTDGISPISLVGAWLVILGPSLLLGRDRSSESESWLARLLVSRCSLSAPSRRRCLRTRLVMPLE